MAECLVPNQMQSNRFVAANDENKKLFLGGLSWETVEEDLYDYFNRYGQVDKVIIKYDQATGRSRGFGFVTFLNDDAVDNVLKTGPHIIKNRTVDPKRPKGKNGLKKIFVGGIDGDLTNDEIKVHFEQFGPIENIERPFDRQRQKSREFCFVIFESCEAAESAISLPKQVIGGKECDIKLAHPHRNNNNNFNQNGGMNPSGMNRGGMGGMSRGGPSNVFFKNRNNQNINSNWRSADHPNGNFRGSNDDQYSDSHFMNNIDTLASQSNNYSNYKPYNSNFLPFWN